MNQQCTIADAPSQAGKRFFITGGNSGIGYYAAVELARRGAIVVLACRDEAKGQTALRQLRMDAAGKDSAADAGELVLLDLASLVSVRKVAAAEVARGLPLHGLINNAGVMAPPRRLETKDGFEMQFGTNVLGHFALTCQLIEPLAAASGTGSRVVTVSSIAHKRAGIDFDDLQSRANYGPMRAYGQSKLADLMFSFELERRLRPSGRDVISIAVHPGVAKSNLFKVGSSMGVAAVAEKTQQAIIGFLLNDGPQGALPTLYAATATNAKGGGYYGPQGLFEIRGGNVGPALVSKAAQDMEAQQKLWNVCAELTGTNL